MSKKISVSRQMTRNVIVANTANKFNQVMEFFTDFNIQHLPIVENDRLIGILSINDVMKYIGKKLRAGSASNLASLDAEFDIKEVMTANPVCVSPDDDFSKVVEILSAGKFQSVPVVEEGVIVGIITNKDVVRVYQETN